MPDDLKPFTCTYQYQGRRIGFIVFARSWEEVPARFRAIGMTATVEGEFILEGDLFLGAGILRNFIHALRKLFRGRR